MNASVLGNEVLCVSLSAVYLYAWYRNVRDVAARQWIVTHTALLLDIEPSHVPEAEAGPLAWLGMVVMLVGSVSVLIGLEARLGAFLLAGFTVVGYIQHRREVTRAMLIADRAKPKVPADAQADFEELRWSAFAGNFSSGLKNLALAGVCIYIVLAGAQGWVISDRVGPWIDAWVHF